MSIPRGHHLIMVEWFACLNDPRRYVGWSLVLLVGPPMPNRSKGRDQTQCDPLALQVGGWAGGWKPIPVKISFITETEVIRISINNGDATRALSCRMTLLCQSRKEDQKPTPSIVNPRIGNWNVRTMFETRKAGQVAREMKRYNLDILGISECRWRGRGKSKLNTGEAIIYIAAFQYKWMKRILRIRWPRTISHQQQNKRWDQTPKMELDRAYNEEEQRGALCYSIGVEARREEETRSAKNNMEENGWRWKTSSWVAIMDDCQSFSSKPKWMERECRSLFCLMARRNIDR